MTHVDPFSPIRLGDLELANRFAMAPMTRARAPERVPTPAMEAYYRQRAGAGQPWGTSVRTTMRSRLAAGPSGASLQETSARLTPRWKSSRS